MRFMALVYFEPSAFDGMNADELRQLDDATIEHDIKMREHGHLLFASPLAGPETARSLRCRDGRLITTDGPFAETKEVVGGFMLIEAKSVEELLPLFEDDPILKYGRLEFRSLVDHRHSETGELRPEPVFYID